MTSLRQRMLEDMRIRNLSSETQTSYVNHVARFARYFHQSPERLGAEDIRAYQLHLINDRHLAPTSVAGAVAALRFLYQTTLKQDWAVDAIASPKRGDRLPVVLSPEEVVRLLSSVADQKHRVILTTCYAAGLRLSEALHLQVGDIDLVIDNQDANGHDLATHAEGFSALLAPRPRGRRTVNSVNSPTRLSTVIVPPCCWVTMS